MIQTRKPPHERQLEKEEGGGNTLFNIFITYVEKRENSAV